MAREGFILTLLLIVCPLVTLGKPQSGLFDLTLMLEGTEAKDDDAVVYNYSCRSVAMYSHSYIAAYGSIEVVDGDTDVPVDITLTILKEDCANVALEDECKRIPSGESELSVAWNTLSTIAKKNKLPIWFSSSNTEYPPEQETETEAGSGDEPNERELVTKDVVTQPSDSPETSPPTAGSQQPPSNKKKAMYTTKSSSIYIVHVNAEMTEYTEANVIIKLKLKMVNPYGYLSAVDYPALVFYGVMTAVYAIYGIIWMIALCCSYKDLIRLQFWVGAVIILGLLEKTFFVSEYSTINEGLESSGVIMVAEAVSAAKRALARMLLIIVSLGFGTVKPRLGDSLGKVVAAGVIYFIFALIDGIVRAKQETYHTQDTSSTVTLALLFIMDTIIFYWIFTALVATRRALRLRKNYVKLSLYNHYAYTLIFAIIAGIGFLIWTFVELSYPRGGCLSDWQEVWLRDCFWHMLFVIILGIVMILWRPSSNRVRFAYSLVNDQDDEEEEVLFDQEPNKNFETVKLRPVTKPNSTPPPVSSQAEDDLRWVEENLPTTAVDKALPLLLDSDEEVMTTKFEISKMN